MADTRLAGFHLTRQEAAGKWAPATYKMVRGFVSDRTNLWSPYGPYACPYGLDAPRRAGNKNS